MKLILLGPPGSGKGTVSECLVHQFHLQHISPGELLREEVSKKTTLGLEIQKYIEKGELVPDKFVVEMIKLEIRRKEDFILDGFPRSLDQAKSIGKMHFDMVIMLDVSEEVIVERLSGRRVCPKCGQSFHLKYIPLKKKGGCDNCRTRLVQRKDDRPKVIKERFKIYHHDTKPLIDYYHRKKIMYHLDASKAPKEVCARAIKLVQMLKKKQPRR